MNTFFYCSIEPFSISIFILIKQFFIGVNCVEINNNINYSKNNLLNIPALHVDNKFYLNSFLSIIKYFSDNNSIGFFSDLFKNYEALDLENFINNYFYFYVFLYSFYDKSIGFIRSEKIQFNIEKYKIGLNNLDNYFSILNERLKYYEYILSDSFSILDICLFSCCVTAEYFENLNLTKYGNIQKWYLKMKLNPNYRYVFNLHLLNIAPSKNFIS